MNAVDLIRGTTAGANCQDCPFSCNGRPSPQAVAGEGSPEPAWIAVGENPGHTEVVLGSPFRGPSGRLLQDALARIGVKREDIYITNSILCPSPPSATEAAKRRAREACMPRLRQEIAAFPGKPIIALGAVAAQGFLGERFSITQMSGAYHEIEVAEGDVRAVIPTVHPAAILRGGSTASAAGSHTVDLMFWFLVYDLQKVDMLARGVDIRFTDDIETEHEDSRRAEELIAHFVPLARQAKSVAIDTETYVDDPKRHTALSPVNAKLRAIGLATEERAISVAWDILTPRSKRLLRAITADSQIAKTFHNSIYDITVLERHGLSVLGRIDDTLLMHHAAFPGLAHDLQRVATQFYAITPWKAEFRAGEGTIEEQLRYNARDSLATARLRAPLSIIVRHNRSEAVYEVDLVMAQIARQMHENGVPISREVNAQLRSGFQAQIDKARREILAKALDPATLPQLQQRLAFEQARRARKDDSLDFDARVARRLEEIRSRPFEFRIGASDYIVAFLRARGVPLVLQTATGRVSTKKDVLEGFVQFPEVRAILTYRENTKLLSTYVERLFDRRYANGRIVYGFADENDRIHPRWSVHKITGRWGSEDPVCQNWPKADKKKGRPNLRSQVVAPQGRVFVGFDFAQLEARLIALLSGDRFLLDIFRNDRDIHSEFARVIWPDFDQRSVDERKVLRDLVKRPEYCSFYGGSVETAWKAVVRDYPNVTLQMISKMVGMMKTKMSGVNDWHQRMIRTAEREGEVRSVIFGRRRMFPLKQFDLSEVINYPVQASAADLMNRGLMTIMPRLPKDAFPILQIHDAAVFECAEDDAEVLKDRVIECFAQEVEYQGVTVKFPVDVKIGKSWADV